MRYGVDAKPAGTPPTGRPTAFPGSVEPKGDMVIWGFRRIPRGPLLASPAQNTDVVRKIFLEGKGPLLLRRLTKGNP